ncbi:MAG TPA: FecR family protein [Xanthobacteraceae bacterium]|nr:FecR family protein [Xanthobacteraceae bacterium]
MTALPTESRNLALTRRTALAGLALLAVPRTASAADSPVGTVVSTEGQAFARLTATRPLSPKADIFLGDLVWTGASSRASLDLSTATKLHLGPKSRLKIDRYVAETGGELVLGEGALVFDRPDGLPTINLEIRTSYGLIGVRGTRFFAGPSRGVFGVFVERGRVQVSAGGVVRAVSSGYGVDIPSPGAPPSLVRAWGRARIDEAFAGVIG